MKNTLRTLGVKSMLYKSPYHLTSPNSFKFIQPYFSICHVLKDFMKDC
jgi:hypothetical protein